MSNYLWAGKEERALGPEHIGLLQLALPMLCESVLRSLVGMIDVMFLSYISDRVVSSVSIASQYITICQIICMSVSTGCIVCINQAIGLKNLKRVNRLASISFGAVLVLSLLFGFMFLFGSRTLLSIMSLEEASIEAAVKYMHIVGCFMIFSCVEIASNDICRSMGRTNAPLIINIAENVINLIGNYFAVFHGDSIGLDALTGVAISTVFSRIVGMCVSLTIAFRSGMRVSWKAFFPFPKRDLRLTLSIGVPGGINNISYSAGQLVTTAIISICGEMMVAAKTYVNNVMNYVTLISIAVGSAGALLVGYKIGSGEYNDAFKIRTLTTRLGVMSNVLFTLVFIAFRNKLLLIFTNDPAILDIGSKIILIDLAVEIGRAMNVTIGSALTAVGDVRYELLVNQASSWIIMVGGSYLFGIVCGLQLYGIWIAFALDELLRGIIMLKRWHSKAWLASAMNRRKTLAN